MAQPVNIPSLDQLKQALVIAEKIERLQFDLATVISSAGVKGSRPGRPAKGVVDVTAFLEAASRVIAGAPVKGKGKRGPKPKEKAPVTTGKRARKKRVMSEEGRRRIIEAQKKRWAAARRAS